MMADQSSKQTMIMAALCTLTPPQLSDLIQSICSQINSHHRRLLSLLSSPTLFSLTLHHLQSLSLHHKSLLIAKYLLSNLTILDHFMQHRPGAPPYSATGMRLRDLDAVLLLLLLCEIYQHDSGALEGPPSTWRVILCNYVCDTMLKLSGIGPCSREVLTEYIESLLKCWNLVNVMSSGGNNSEVNNGSPEAAASPAAVVALPSVEVSGGCGRECVICKEEMNEGRDVCELPCGHLFHWICILPWLKKRNTCPCCRYRLPTDDVIGEIRRVFEDLSKVGGSSSLNGECLCI